MYLSQARISLIIACLFFLACDLSAQRFGGNPPSLKWKQVNTTLVRVVYPVGLVSQASRVANIADKLQQSTAASIGDDTRKIDIVLQNQTIISNGYVGLAPWRSEFYMTPLQNSLELGSLPWTDNLAIHEYRHVQQYMNFNKGLSRLAYFLFGEQGLGVANAMAIPDWFFEGDAVHQETKVSAQGRGRLPQFFGGYRALWEEGKNYSWQKLRNGSLKDYVPNHYPLGYLMVAYGYEVHGPSFWKSVTDRAVRYKPTFYPMQGAIQKISGQDYPSFRDSALTYFQRQNPASETLPGKHISRKGRNYVSNYGFPTWKSTDTILTLKRTYRDIPAWYVLTEGREMKLAVKDIGIDDYYVYRNGKIVYTKYKPDLRWAWKDHSEIVVMDLQSKKRKQITEGARYFTPDLSPDGNLIVATRVDTDGKSFLDLMNADSGRLVKTMANPAGYFFTYPVFSSSGREIYTAIRNRAGQMALAQYHIVSETAQIIIPFSFQPIAFLKTAGKRIIFTSGHNRKDETWCWNEESRKLERLTSLNAGTYQADIDTGSGKLVYSGFTADGLQLYIDTSTAYKTLSPEDWAAESTEVYPLATIQHAGTDLLSSVSDTLLAHKKYGKGFRLFNFHSWLPYYEQPDWSLTVYGQNILNTFQSQLYYQYNQNEFYHRVGWDGVYGAWFPYLTGGLSYTFDRKFTGFPDSTGERPRFIWDELNLSAGLRIPLNLSGGRWFRNITFTGNWNTQQLWYKESKGVKPDDQSLQFIQTSLNYTTYIQQARQHIFPRWAFTTSMRLRTALGDTEANQFLATLNAYFPGIRKTHHLVVDLAFQARDTANEYLFTNNFPLSRGYPGIDLPRMWKWGVNYHMPLLYPDLGLANIVYFLRVRSNFFYDVSTVKSLRTGSQIQLRSTGLELYFDTRWWNQQPVSFGIRYARLLDADKFFNAPNANHWEIVLPVNLVR